MKKCKDRSKGLEGAGEWHVLKPLIPDLRNKSVLDLGCGFGWHCRYSREQQASSVIGVDLSDKMLQKAREMTNDPLISYFKMPIEDIDFSDAQFDVVISSLAFHYAMTSSIPLMEFARFTLRSSLFLVKASGSFCS